MAARTQRLWRIIQEALKGEEKVYTTGSINRALLLLAIPMIMEMTMESLFALVDAYFVGGLANAAATLVGQNLGAGAMEACEGLIRR